MVDNDDDGWLPEVFRLCAPIMNNEPKVGWWCVLGVGKWTAAAMSYFGSWRPSLFWINPIDSSVALAMKLQNSLLLKMILIPHCSSLCASEARIPCASCQYYGFPWGGTKVSVLIPTWAGLAPPRGNRWLNLHAFSDWRWQSAKILVPNILSQIKWTISSCVMYLLHCY